MACRVFTIFVIVSSSLDTPFFLAWFRVKCVCGELTHLQLACSHSQA